jgi:hypothetical protein
MAWQIRKTAELGIDIERAARFGMLHDDVYIIVVLIVQGRPTDVWVLLQGTIDLK